MYPQNIIRYVRSEKFKYPSKKKTAVCIKNNNANSYMSPANAIRAITSVQKPSTRNIRPMKRSPFKSRFLKHIIPFGQLSVNPISGDKTANFLLLPSVPAYSECMYADLWLIYLLPKGIVIRKMDINRSIR
jgi:hypothetical protein